MSEVSALMSQALATAAMASAISASEDPAPATPPQPQEEQNTSSSAFREAHADYIELRKFANEVDGRWGAAIKALHAASEAATRPGEELNQTYDAYRKAYLPLQAAEVSVRDAEEREDAVVDELRRAGEVVDAAEEKVAWAAKSLRIFDAGRGKDDYGDGDGDDFDDGDRERALSGDSDKPCQSRRARESLVLALKTAASNADRALAAQYRVEEEAIAVMTLVGARTAGEWSLAAEACDAAQKRFQRAGLEAIPKVKLFSEKARLFVNLNKLRGETTLKLSEASQTREAARAEATGRWR